jgi:chemotaxis regulatin CheY-phosphate phosphatase CheZ
MRRKLAMDERLEELRRKLDQKTTEIESLVAADQGMGSIENMESSEYERLEQTVEELLGRWEELLKRKVQGASMIRR